MKNGKMYLLTFTLLLAMPVFAHAQQSDKAAPAAAAPHGQTTEAIPALSTRRSKNPSAIEEERLTREVRHELVMQPYYTIWDWLAFRVNGETVELVGDANSNGLKHDAVNSVKQIEGVRKVIDHINQLPPSSTDDRIRKEVARAIFNWGALSQYSWSAVPSIHIIVSGGRVRLEGIVNSQQDKDAAGLRANGVSDAFQVTNNLQVVKD
jgi:hyperosmotically inducible periplasmic protein